MRICFCLSVYVILATSVFMPRVRASDPLVVSQKAEVYGDLTHHAQVTLGARRHNGGIRYLQDKDDPHSVYTDWKKTRLARMQSISLHGSYPREKAPLDKQIAAAYKLDNSLHPGLKMLEWHNSSRRISLAPLKMRLPRVKALTHLTLTGGVLEHESVLEVLSLPSLASLTYLDLSHNCLKGQLLAGLQKIPCAPHLQKLILNGNHIGLDLPEIQENDALQTHYPNLTYLDISANNLGNGHDASFFLGSLPALESLLIDKNGLTSQSLGSYLALQENPGIRTLRARHNKLRSLKFLEADSCLELEKLDIRGNNLCKGVASLSKRSCRQTLTHVDISRNQLDADTLEALLVETFPALLSLVLDQNPLHAGLNMLGATSSLPALKRLSLVHTRATTAQISQVVSVLELDYLNVQKNNLSTTIVQKASCNPALKIVPAPQEEVEDEMRFTYIELTPRRTCGKPLGNMFAPIEELMT